MWCLEMKEKRLFVSVLEFKAAKITAAMDKTYALIKVDKRHAKELLPPLPLGCEVRGFSLL